MRFSELRRTSAARGTNSLELEQPLLPEFDFRFDRSFVKHMCCAKRHHRINMRAASFNLISKGAPCCRVEAVERRAYFHAFILSDEKFDAPAEWCAHFASRGGKQFEASWHTQRLRNIACLDLCKGDAEILAHGIGNVDAVGWCF